MDKQTLIIITNILVAVVILGVGLYVYMNLDDVQNMMKDPCRVCEQKTDGKCIRGVGILEYTMMYPSNTEDNFPTQPNNP